MALLSYYTRLPHPRSATPCTGRRPLRNSSPTRCWTWRWSRCGCSTCRPTSRLRACQTAWAAWGCSTALRPHTRVAWWNSRQHSTTRPPRRATGTCTNSSSYPGRPRSTADRTCTTRTRSAWARRASRSRPRPPSRRGRARRRCNRAPRSTQPPRYSKGEAQRGRGRTGTHELRSFGLDGGLQAPCPGYHGAQAIQANGPHGAGVHGRGRHHGTRGGVASATAAPRPLPRHAAPPASRNAHADATPHGRAAVRREGGATGRRRGEFCPPPRPGADRGKHTRATARRAPSYTNKFVPLSFSAIFRCMCSFVSRDTVCSFRKNVTRRTRGSV